MPCELVLLIYFGSMCLRSFYCVAVGDFVPVFVYVKGRVGLGEADGFDWIFFFVGERFFELNLISLQLGSRVFKLVLTGVQVGGKAV